jgi:hypothetical protein
MKRSYGQILVLTVNGCNWLTELLEVGSGKNYDSLAICAIVEATFRQIVQMVGHEQHLMRGKAVKI